MTEQEIEKKVDESIAWVEERVSLDSYSKELIKLQFIHRIKQLILSDVGCSLPSKNEYNRYLEEQFNKISKSKNSVNKRYFTLGFHFAYKFVTNYMMK